MKTIVTIVIIGICLAGIPMTSFAALDWRIEWDETESPHTARVFIFNPEERRQSFTLEIGDIAKTSDDDPYAPYLIVGQDISLMNIRPSTREIFDIVVYQDIDSQGVFSSPPGAMASQKNYEQHQQQVRALGERYGTIESRQYPMSIQAVVPVPRDEGVQNRTIYKSSRGYWITTLIDHDHIAEQLIRTGDRMGASYTSIQQALFYYTQGTVQLSGEALEVWRAAFPELNAQPGPSETPTNCIYYVTVVTSNISAYSSGRAITVGDILAPSDPQLSLVVAAENATFTIGANTPNSKRTLRVYPLSKYGTPSQDSEYTSLIGHDSQLEEAILVGNSIQYSACGILDVIWYLKNEVPTLTTGQGLWEYLNGVITPTPTPYGGQSPCLGNPVVYPSGRQQASSQMTMKNLAVLLGAVIPFGVVVRRKGRKDFGRRDSDCKGQSREHRD